MKTIKLLASLVILIFLGMDNLQAQVLVEEGNRWNMSVSSMSSPNTFSYSLLIQGDTLIANQQYYKIYRSSDSSGNDWTFYHQYLRQDSTNKVYLKERGGTESLIYDFNLAVNDTFEATYDCVLVVTEIDSILLLNGEQRKRLKLNNIYASHPSYEYWIEGIGSDYGLLAQFPVCFFDFQEGLLCFYQNDELIHMQNPSSCFITQVSEIDDQAIINVYPSPFTSLITIEDQQAQLSSYSIYNTNGVIVKEGLINNIITNLELPNLPPGFYTAILTGNQGNVLSKKLIKH